MEHTGRIKEHILPDIQKILYGHQTEDEFMSEIQIMTEIDKAHVLMLCETGNLSSTQARQLLAKILELERTGYSSLEGKPMPRGLYMLYEDYLIDRLGIETGGMLQLGRSRNDLKATVFLIKARKQLIALIKRLETFCNLLIEKAAEYQCIVMPIYTHYQPAMPVTYGHYLLGFLQGMLRSISMFLFISDTMDQCPLGAGAAAGTDIPIDAHRTAQLLGFSKSVENSIDAVASRDCVLRLLGEMTVINSHISRICEDLQLWTSSDFNFIDMPDFLVGGSSMMPNKRNVFLLENIKGRSAEAIGAFVSAVNATTGAPFTNSIAVGTEAVSYLWKPMEKLTDSIVLLGYIIMHGAPNRERMLERVSSGYTLATAQANLLVKRQNLSFREAHRLVGNAISQSHENGISFDGQLSALMGEEYSPDATSVTLSMSYGAGPGSFQNQYGNGLDTIRSLTAEIDKRIHIWEEARMLLESEVGLFLKREVEPQCAQEASLYQTDN